MNHITVKIRNAIKYLFRKAGFELRQVSRKSIIRQSKSSLYQSVINLILMNRPAHLPLEVMVIGANDGRINDPIYDIVKKNPDRFTLILVEPNPKLIPILESNYNFMDPEHAEIINCGIGPDNTLDLYLIREEYWPQCQPKHAKIYGWPLYRAPTGITTADRHVLVQYIEEYFPGVQADDVIERITVPSMRVTDLADGPPDILQIDVEGFDDDVIYASGLREGKPQLVFFEATLFSKKRLQRCCTYLEEAGYSLYPHGDNILAIYG